MSVDRDRPEIGLSHAQAQERFIQRRHDRRRAPSLRRLIGGVETRQQLQVILRDHVNPLAVLEGLRNLAALGNELGRKLELFDGGEIEDAV